MNTKLNIYLVIVSCCFVESIFAQPAQENPVSWALSGTYLIPGQDEDWDSAYGGDVEVIFWQSETVGYGFSLGYQSWDSANVEEQAQIGDILFTGSVLGDATFIPIGASLFIIQPVGEKSNFLFEVGIRYMVANSDVIAQGSQTDSDQNVTVISEAPINIDDGVISVISIAFETPISDNVLANLALGLQADLVEGDVTFEGEKIGENSLEAIFVQAGIRW